MHHYVFHFPIREPPASRESTEQTSQEKLGEKKLYPSHCSNDEDGAVDHAAPIVIYMFLVMNGPVRNLELSKAKCGNIPQSLRLVNNGSAKKRPAPAKTHRLAVATAR